MFLPTGTLLYQQIHFQVVNKGFLWHLAKVQSRTIQGSVHSLSTCNNTVQFFVHSTTVLRNKLCVHIFVWIGVSFICKILNCHISTLPWKEIFSTTYTYQESSNMQELHFSSVADVHTTTGVHFHVSSTNLEMSVLSENELGHWVKMSSGTRLSGYFLFFQAAKLVKVNFVHLSAPAVTTSFKFAFAVCLSSSEVEAWSWD